MKNFRHSSPWTLLLFFSTLSSLLATSYAQDSTSSTDSGDVASENAAGASGPGSSMISSKSHDVVITLSVIVGVVAVLGGWSPHLPCELSYAAIPRVSEILTS